MSKNNIHCVSVNNNNGVTKNGAKSEENDETRFLIIYWYYYVIYNYIFSILFTIKYMNCNKDVEGTNYYFYITSFDLILSLDTIIIDYIIIFI